MMRRHGNGLLFAIFAGAVAGIVCGAVFGEQMLALRWLGDLFLDALKMLIVPLIVAAVISGVASMGDMRKLGRIGGWTLVYYLSTTALAVLLGLLLVNLLEPGAGNTISGKLPEQLRDHEGTGITDIIRSLITPNLISAAAETRLLPIIVFCLLFAAALTTIGPRADHVRGFFEGINEVMMKLVLWLMYAAPIGVFALVAAQLGEAGGGRAFWQELSAVGEYFATVALGLMLHSLLLYAIMVTLARRGGAYLRQLGQALITAFGTASSSATLPLTMECAQAAGIDKRAIRFVLPLGATVNMDGTALYEAVAAMFIAQAYGVDLGFGAQAIIFVTATLAAIGAAGIPQAGLVTMVIVLTAVDLPLEGIGLLLAVDWFLDRLRTTVNVWGDAVGAAVIDKLLRSE
jgi:Na+/H+-dicarboxylate symporter